MSIPPAFFFLSHTLYLAFFFFASVKICNRYLVMRRRLLYVCSIPNTGFALYFTSSVKVYNGYLAMGRKIKAKLLSICSPLILVKQFKASHYSQSNSVSSNQPLSSGMEAEIGPPVTRAGNTLVM
ncbi:hypothetical protein K501DRAFT_337254 [Backusella circina FSU 941]|nr:hypothetical protein K501DRAFT_337254 [Backusella circina FSU 941]